MNLLYIIKISATQAGGKQIDIPKKIAADFFNVTAAVLDGTGNMDINVCHANDLTSFETITIQSATNIRFSTRLNTFLAENGDVLEDGDLLVVEKIGRTFSVRLIKKADKKYEPLVELFDEDEKHMLLSANLSNQPTETSNISAAYRQYITAIKSKPFLLLAGISGTGKSRIVRELARACWEVGSKEYEDHKPANFEMVQVKPNWHDSSDLIGYISRVSGKSEYMAGPFLKAVAKAWENPDMPYFLCLDEMNLAPVEQYFAEYLSVIESRKYDEDKKTVITDPILPAAFKKEDGVKTTEEWYEKLVDELLVDCPDNTIYGLRAQFLDNGITIPQNLIVVGTVNMDETTFSFSRKVLDRAMTIEMNEVDMDGGLIHRYEKIGKLEKKHLIGSAVEGVDVYEACKADCNLAIDYLKKVNGVLEGTPFKVAYRTRNEFLLYMVNNLPYHKDGEEELDHNWIIARSLDEMTCMKVLTRIEGDDTKVSKDFLGKLSKTIKQELENLSGCTYTADRILEDKAAKTYYSASLAKIEEMTARLATGYTSFWS